MTNNLDRRIRQHKLGQVLATRNKGKLKLVLLEKFKIELRQEKGKNTLNQDLDGSF